MFSSEEGVYQFFQQPGIAQAPAVPSGISIPGDQGWNVKKSRNTFENEQKHADGFARQFARGNHTSTAGGKIIYNLPFLGHMLKALCSALSSAAFTGVYSITVTDRGSGYTPATVSVAITLGGGTGATAKAVVIGGQVWAIVLTNRGTGYGTVPTVTITDSGAGAGATATATIDLAKTKHTGVLGPGAPLYHLIEKGVLGQTLFRRYYDMVLKKLSFSDELEGICTIDDEWSGTGLFETKTTSLDATPTEVTGTPADYTSLFILEGGEVGGVISKLTADVEVSLVEKRVPNSLSTAMQLRKGTSKVTGSGTAYFEDEALLTKMDNGTLTTLKSVISSADGVFERDMDEVEFKPGDWERSDEGIVVPFEYESVKNTGANGPIKFTLIVPTASY